MLFGNTLLGVISVTFVIFCAVCGAACFELVHSSLGDREDIFIIHLITIIK